MPYNEFVLFRRSRYPDERQIVVLLFKPGVNPCIAVPDGLELHCINRDLDKLKKLIREIRFRAQKENASVVFHIHEAKSVLFFSLAACLRYRKKIIYTLHSTYSRYPMHNKLFAIAATFLSRSVICVSQTAYRYYPAWLKALNKNKVRVIQNGVDCDRIHQALASVPKNERCGDRGKIRLVCIARLIPLKKHEILFDALRELPACTLTLIGEGNRRKELEALADEYGMADRVFFEGLIDRDHVYHALLQSSVFVSSSSYEGLPISLLEAMSCGVVCAVSDIEQHREIKEKCPSLILVNNTPEDWARVLQSVAEMPLEERERIAKQNKKDVDEHFSLERMHRQYDIVYQEIAEEKHAR